MWNQMSAVAEGAHRGARNRRKSSAIAAGALYIAAAGEVASALLPCILGPRAHACDQARDRRIVLGVVLIILAGSSRFGQEIRVC